MWRFLLAAFFLGLAGPATELSCQVPSAHNARSAPDTAEAKRQLRELEERWGRAFVNHDSASLRSLIAEDYIGIYPTRRYGKRDLLLMADEKPKEGQRALVGTDPDHSKQIRVFGDAAVVTGSATYRFREPDGAQSVLRTVYTEVFVWRDGRWQCVAGHYTPLLASN